MTNNDRHWLLLCLVWLTITLTINAQTNPELPIIDDFSDPDSNWNTSLWDLNLTTAHLNNSRAIRPPSIGVVSFDGYDATGHLYKTREKDQLVMLATDLSVSKGSNIYLTFYLEFGGYGAISNPVESSLELLMVDEQGKENSIKTWYESDLAETDRFYITEVEVDDKYLHSKSQFIFRLLSDQDMDLNDSWHLDYFTIQEGTPQDFSFDISFSNVPTSLLSKYTSMPFDQFYVRPHQMLADSVTISLYNHFPYREKLLQDRFTIRSSENDVNFSSSFLLTVPDVQTNQNVLNQGSTVYRNPLPKERLIEYLTSFAIEKNHRFHLFYDFYQDEEELFQAETFLRNNEIKQTLLLEDRFAMDDGTYEESLYIRRHTQATSPAIALEYESFLDDDLLGFEILLLNSSTQEQVDFQLSIYSDTLLSDPILEVENVSLTPSYNQEKQVFEFQEVRLSALGLSPLHIPHGKFYIVLSLIDKPRGYTLTFGFDKSSYRGFNNFYYRGSRNEEWLLQEGKTYAGYAMVRPIMATRTDVTTPISSAEDPLNKVSIYPNPSSGKVLLAGLSREASRIDIYTITGQKVLSTSTFGQENIPLHVPEKGAFMVAWFDKNGILLGTRQLFIK